MTYEISTFDLTPTGHSNLARSAAGANLIAGAQSNNAETIKADSILFEDGFVKFFCSGSKNLVAAYPAPLVRGIKQTEE